MANEFSINMDTKPHLTSLKDNDVDAFRTVVGTFVNIMELAAERQWHKLPEHIHSSLSFADLVNAILDATLTTEKLDMDTDAYATLGVDLHPLSLISDKRVNLITGDHELYDWRTHFNIDSSEVSRETLEKIIRKMFYMVRWFDVHSVSHALSTREFPIIDAKDIQKLPFQPALRYQKETLGELWVGKFLHEIGALNCGEIDKEVVMCPACMIEELTPIKETKVCKRCNAGFTLKEEFKF